MHSNTLGINQLNDFKKIITKFNLVKYAYSFLNNEINLKYKIKKSKINEI